MNFIWLEHEGQLSWIAWGSSHGGSGKSVMTKVEKKLEKSQVHIPTLEAYSYKIYHL